ncbi:extracellular serine-rich protein [Echria macrotheca]|uniref:Extracellular serine-rich protein n=1 Tax=Echria macrotheca TaxID=438768 RepID=A0AAJ0F899_9PEZI|nr:extracellular serine-rich protein [Echria macrotheca]
MLQSLLSLPIMATAAAAATVSVAVGQNGFTFSPSSVTAAIGDIIEYSFFPPNHSVIMGDFNNACMPAATGGFFSGFMTGASSASSSSSSSSGGGGGGLGYRQTSAGGSVFQVKINSTDPIFFYCGVPTHCQAGMVGVINPNSSQTLSAYQSKASSSSNTGVPSNVFGGTVVAAGSSGGSSTGTGSASPSSTKGSGSEGMHVSRAMLAVTAAGVFVGLLMA